MAYDVLEQIVDDVLQRDGYFTRLNVRFQPSPSDPDYDANKDNQASDIDVLAVRPTADRDDPSRVLAVSCKSHQDGFTFDGWLDATVAGRRYCGRQAWRHLRELWVPKWARAHHQTVRQLTGADTYTLVLASTAGTSDVDRVQAHPTVAGCLGPNRLATFELADLWQQLRTSTSQTVEPSDVGRLAQMLNAAGAA